MRPAHSARPARSTRTSLLAALSLAAVLAPLTAAVPNADASAALPRLTNQGFEQGTAAWHFTPGTGVAGNNPHSGSKLVYLDGGTGKKVWQTVSARKGGTYDVSAWIATGWTGGKFTVRVNGTVAGSVGLPYRAAYARYTVPRIAAKSGDRIEIAFESGDGWINADDVSLARSGPAVTDPGFEQGGGAWQFTDGTGVATNNPHSGGTLAYLDDGAGRTVSQTVTANGPGTYAFSAWIATGGPGGAFTVRVNGAVAGTVALPAAPGYARYTVPRVAVRAGDRIEIAFASADGAGWVNVDDVMVSPLPADRPTVTSSDPKIAELFAWAADKADSWVQLPGATGPVNADERQTGGTGTSTYEASYWAGYAHRSAFYGRDTAHQVDGAAALGLDTENRNMLGAFAATATEEQQYYPVWALNFDDRTNLSIDYYGPNSFVREVPSTFELVEKADRAYRWSGDPSYVTDPALWAYYRHATEDFVTLHDSAKPNGVAEGTGKGIFSGAASYDESGDDRFAESGDSIGSQYQALLAVADLATGRGDAALAAQYAQRAADLKNYFNTTWSGTGSGADMVRGYRTDGTPVTGWGRENSWFMPMKKITEAGPRNDAYLDYIDQQSQGDGRPANIEAYTYLPDAFFAYDRNDTAWKWMQYVYDRRDERHVVSKQGPNGDYPEVSFTLVGQTVEGLLGVDPNAPARTLTTASHLPTGTDWLQIDDLVVGGNTFALRHDGASGSTLTNRTGTDTYRWEARIPGTHPVLTVDGTPRAAATRTVDGTVYSYVTVPVAPGATATVRVP
ncbi:carbohydrate-binding protein [Kitasatospora cineracea]|uniref:carbohydrate-binding protein n=1 Tax=Kitasatospora cineracea TaxID=88074 RepID=UPI003417E5B4